MQNNGDNITYPFFKDKLNRVKVPDEVFTAACQSFIFERNKRRKRRFFYWVLTALVMMVLTILGIQFFTRSSTAWRNNTPEKRGSAVMPDSISLSRPVKYFIRDTAGYNRKNQTMPVRYNPGRSGKDNTVVDGNVLPAALNDSAITNHSLGFDKAAKKDTASVLRVKIGFDSGLIKQPPQKRDSFYIVW